MNSIAYKSPIVEQLVFNVIVKYPQNLEKREKHTVDTSLVPRLHDKIVQKANFQQSMLHDIKDEPHMIEESISENKISYLKEGNVESRKIFLTKPIISHNGPKAVSKPWESYKKIFPILKDPFVSHIECKGPNVPITVVKNGKAQTTNIILNRQEIDEYLNFLSEKTRLPLVEGVFHALVEDYSINAIISNSLEPRFIIKKNQIGGTGYGRPNY